MVRGGFVCRNLAHKVSKRSTSYTTRIAVSGFFVFSERAEGQAPEAPKTMDAIEVGVLGATGMVGQRFVSLLARHPWFRLTWLAASERSEGKAYKSVAPWKLNTPIPGGSAERIVEG